MAPTANLLELHSAVAPTSIKLIQFLEPAALLTKALLHAIHQDGGHPQVFSAHTVPLKVRCVNSICECAADNKALEWEVALVLVEAALELNDRQVVWVHIRCARWIGHLCP
jgi:hypothetical protein